MLNLTCVCKGLKFCYTSRHSRKFIYMYDKKVFKWKYQFSKLKKIKEAEILQTVGVIIIQHIHVGLHVMIKLSIHCTCLCTSSYVIQLASHLGIHVLICVNYTEYNSHISIVSAYHIVYRTLFYHLCHDRDILIAFYSPVTKFPKHLRGQYYWKPHKMDNPSRAAHSSHTGTSQATCTVHPCV